MRNLLILAVFFGVIFTSCKKYEDNHQRGTITGPDLRECVCCGGWYIEISNSTYRFYNLPGGSEINLEHETFPLQVLLDWRIDPNACIGDEIIIIRINKI